MNTQNYIMIFATVLLIFISTLVIIEIFNEKTFVHSYTHELCPPMLWLDGHFDCQNLNHHLLRVIGAFTIIGSLMVYWGLQIADMKRKPITTLTDSEGKN